MAAGRRERDALTIGQETVAYIRSGAFRQRSTQTMGADIRRLLRLLGTRNVSFGSPEATWTVVLEMVRETLVDLADSIRIFHIRGSRPGVGVISGVAEEFPLTPGEVLGAQVAAKFADIDVTDYVRAAARMIGTFAPSFVDVIPAQYRLEAYPPGSRPPPSTTQHIEVNVPMEEIRAEVRGLGEQLGEQVQAGLIAGFDKIAATLPQLVRNVPAPAPVYVPPPAPAPVPTTEPAPFAGFEPGTLGAPPKTSSQRDLFGTKVVAAPVQATLGQPLPPLAQNLEDKYRPLFLEDVLGNSTNVSVLRGAAQTGNFGKLYLVTGRPGIGKTSAVIASIRDYLLPRQGAFGTQLFNPNYSPSSPTFGIAPNELLYVNALSLVTRGGPAALIGDLAKFTKTLPYPGLRSFVVVDDVTKFNKDQQAILLPLTERYPRTTFFFIANDADYIDALESRARHLRWGTPEPEEIAARLVTIIRNENLPFPDPLKEAQRIVNGLGRNREFRQAIIQLAADVTELQGQVT